MFTVKDVFILGAALVGDRENDDKDEKDFAPVHMTILLQEALDAFHHNICLIFPT